jgi:hypothetical protein
LEEALDLSSDRLLMMMMMMIMKDKSMKLQYLCSKSLLNIPFFVRNITLFPINYVSAPVPVIFSLRTWRHFFENRGLFL